MPQRELRYLVESGGSNGGLFGPELRPGRKYTAMIEGKRYIAEVMDQPSADAPGMDTGKDSYDYATRAPGKPKLQEEDDMHDGNDPLDTLAERISRLQRVHEELSGQVTEDKEDSLTPPPEGAPAPRGNPQERGKRPQSPSQPVPGRDAGNTRESRQPRLGRYDSTRPLMERGRPWWRSGRAFDGVRQAHRPPERLRGQAPRRPLPTPPTTRMANNCQGATITLTSGRWLGRARSSPRR
jgi:hypothetical protein